MNAKIKSGLIALAVAAAAVTTLNFDAKSVNKNKATRLYYTYNLSTSTGAKNPSNWALQTSPGSSCGTPGSTPCKVSFDSSEYIDIIAYLNAQNFTSDAEVAYGEGVISKE
ncbi:hypothetical protein DBR11_09285 [Pedobacter sp. HMWF019]|uniref:hypothetical protein n=1 Tax=Pedobacter sp. HMWF019 TaxID=2056856 RepID=UPI000D35D8C2|nr:hypothetical protein [Pedobacter sp. HMWF019]PTT00713.1 hypothetical protein DBR11_09285 [Pedobacter sp. HMWF019]